MQKDQRVGAWSEILAKLSMRTCHPSLTFLTRMASLKIYKEVQERVAKEVQQ
jgi:hypothetical protein